MAAKPIERYVKRQIADQGGWDRILERIASGETVADVARTLLRPDGQHISRAFLSRLLHHDPERSAKVLQARTEGASAMVDDALRIVDTTPMDRDATQHARSRAEVRLRVAGLIDREHWGDRKQDINIQVNTADIHLDALRHRQVQAWASGSDSERQLSAIQASGTQELALATVSKQHRDSEVQEVAPSEVPPAQ